MYIILALLLIFMPVAAPVMSQATDIWETSESTKDLAINTWYKFYIPLWQNYIDPYVWSPIVNFYHQKKDMVIGEISRAFNVMKERVKESLKWW